MRNCPVLDVDASDLALDACVSIKTTLVSGRSGQFYVKNVDVQNYASSQGEVERKHFKEYFFIICGLFSLVSFLIYFTQVHDRRGRSGQKR